jgi:hypothetical protein
MSNKLYCIVCNDGNSCYCALDDMSDEEPPQIQPVNNINYNNISNMPTPYTTPYTMTYIINQLNNITINNS